MTTDLLIPTIVLLVAFIALDILLLRARWHISDKNDSFTDTAVRIADLVKERFNSLKSILRKKERAIIPTVNPPAALDNEEPTETPNSLAVPIAGIQDVAEDEADSNSTPENKEPAKANPVRIQITAEVPPGSVVHITISTEQDGVPLVQQRIETSPATVKPPQLGQRLSKSGRTNYSLANFLAKIHAIKAERLSIALFTLALVVYLVTRFIGLTNFPIYFFGDEAVQTNSAADLISRDWKGPDGQFLPTYFQNGPYFNLGASVYVQALPTLLFGKSVLVTRGTSVLISLLAALSIGLLLRDAFGSHRWWLATLLLSLAPAWFLHSRTAFETVIFGSFYATFLYFYLLYRLRNPKFIYPATILAGLTFYAYSPGQLVLAVTGLFLFFSDIKYHWQNRGFVLRALPLLAILALPYIRFRYSVDYSPLDHLRQLGSYWILPISTGEKLSRYFATYLYGLSPLYWFLPGAPDLVRHQMRGYGNLPIWALPFFVWGLIVSLRHIREGAYRAILLAMLAAPAGAALAEIGITRVLVFTIPATIISAIGFDSTINWLDTKLRERYPLAKPETLQMGISVTIFLILAGMSFSMLGDALANGPIWFQDYGLYGMQFGSQQIFEQTVIPTLKADPQARFVVTPSWANGAEEFTRFFIPTEYQGRVRLGQIYDLIAEKPKLDPNYYFIVTPDELNKIDADDKFQNVTVRTTIPLPTGKPGFYVLNLEFSKDIDTILAEQKAARSKLIEETFEWNEQAVRVLHSPLGAGQLKDLMDDRPDTLAKTLDTNPFVLDYYFPNAIPTSSVNIQTSSFTDFTITVKLYAPGSSQAVEYSQTYKGLPPDPSVTIPFPNGPTSANHIFISVKNNSADESGIIHIREITFK